MNIIERHLLAEGERHAVDRDDFVGASEVAIMVGESSWGSLAETFAIKKKLRPPKADSGVLRRGRWAEGAVFEALADERPAWTVRRAKVHVRNRERRLACTPDGFAKRPDRDGLGVVQAKSISRSIFKNGSDTMRPWLDNPDDSIEHGDVTVPASYRLQTITEMMLNELDWGVLAVLITGEFDWTLRTFDIERDAMIEERILDGVERFWRDYFDPNIMPPYDVQRDEALIKALYPKDDGTVIDLRVDNRALALVDELGVVQEARKRLEARESEIKTELTGKLGAHTYGRLADGRFLSWKLTHRKAFAVAPADFRVLRLLATSPKGLII